MKIDLSDELVAPKPQYKLDDIGSASIGDAEAQQLNPKAKQKKPYVKPAFRYEKVFVTSALSCGKLSGTCSSTSSKVS
jgi:hypothetical protein